MATGISGTLSRRALCAGLGAFSAVRAQAARPNIVYILADDLGWGDLSCYNVQSRIRTPHVDGLAARGVRFTDMHSPSSVCTPTRYGILTGRYAWRTRLKSGVLQGYSPNLIEPGRTTVASLLKQAGYRTGGVGKWHLGLGTQEPVDYSQRLKPSPNDHGFDYFFGIPASLDMPPYLYVENDRATEQPTSQTPGGGSAEPEGPFWRAGAIAPSLKIGDVLPALTRKSVDFVRQCAKGTQPFFLYFPMTGPHTPWMPTEAFRGKSGAGEYGDFVLQMDDTVGQVLRALDETGAASNTLVIFTSDNGSRWTPEQRRRFRHDGNGPWRGMKADVWEGGHRIPFITRWPGRAPEGKVRADLGCLTDLIATVAEITRTPLTRNTGEDSFSLLPAISGTGNSQRDAIVHHSSMGMFSIRRGRWKLIPSLGSGGFSEPKSVTAAPGEPPGQLYDLTNDPSESKNVYAENAGIVKELTALLETYQRQGYSRPQAL